MRLSLICLFKKSVNGHIFRGKDRLVKRVSQRAMDTLRKEYDRQEKNMILLRHPYLTPVSIIKKINKYTTQCLHKTKHCYSIYNFF